jgi:hypothetical protein
MAIDYSDRRKFPRVVFSVSEGVIGKFFISSKKNDIWTAYILNLSEDGLFFTLRSDQRTLIKKDDILNFISIKMWGNVQSLVNIQMRVMWTGWQEEGDNIGIGCKFIEISDTSKKSISKLIEQKLSIV